MDIATDNTFLRAVLHPHAPIQHIGALETDAATPAARPRLAGIPSGSAINVVCTVPLARLPGADRITAALDLSRISAAGARLVLVVGANPALPLGKLTLLLEAAGLRVLFGQNVGDEPVRKA